MTRVEYTLSLENYLEMTQSRREKRDYRPAVVSALLGFSLIAAGYTYLQISPESKTFIGGLMLATGLLATGLALLLGFLAKPRSSRPDMATLRSEYDLFHSDNRAIEFDENGWRLFWYEGEDVRPWSCLRVVQDLKTLLVLSTETTYYWLPRAALERDGQMTNLKTLAEAALGNRELLFTVPLRPPATVYVAATFFHKWRGQFAARLIGYGALTLPVYWIAFADKAGPARPIWLLALVPVLLVLGDSLHYLLLYLRWYFFSNWRKSAKEAQIMSDCIGYKTDAARWIVTYRRVSEYRETPGAFLLYYDQKNFTLIPKKGFSGERLDQFRKLIRENRQTV